MARAAVHVEENRVGVVKRGRIAGPAVQGGLPPGSRVSR